ncbi:glycosyltransferase 87 family protein [Actinoplanes sp. NPDC051411]|uniref:glycosyltransferase 87 family protein n=1 Tax=Actinoplanes sp. NPDC051411 TaxID=3155522 RepID=UPI003416ACA5
MSAWAHRLVAGGGWKGLSERIGNYNAPYLYLLLLATYLPGPLIIKMKLVWTAFDVVLAFFTYKLVGLARPGPRIPVIAALITVFLPTVVLNAAYIGQLDDMWASLCVAALYFLLRKRYWWALSMLGVAFALKPQAIFFFPVIGLLLLVGRVPWRTVLAVPAVYLALDVPALVAGRDARELLTIYSPGRQMGVISQLSYTAPSVYYFIPASPDRVGAVRLLGEILLAAIVLGIYYVLIVRRVEMTDARIVTVSLLFAILVPYLLPGMHERYFFLADVLSVAVCFWRPRLWPVPLLVQASSLASYFPFFFHRLGGHFLPMTLLSTIMLAALITIGYQVLKDAADGPAPISGAGLSRTPVAAPRIEVPSPRQPEEQLATLPARPA